ncbi:E4 ORF2 [Squirrel monkey adenovirus]|nr:E4 ORF2 [Squirrel monkey adenovirus]
MASVDRPLWCLIHVPSRLLSHLEGRGLDVLRLVALETESFWRCCLEMKRERGQAYVGVHELERGPEGGLRLLCCVGTRELEAGSSETREVLEDLLDALKHQIVWQSRQLRVVVTDDLLGLLQVTEEPDAIPE